MEKYLEAGQIINTHGVRGDIKVKNLCNSTGVLCGIRTFYLREGGAFTPVSAVRSVPFGADTALIRLEGCETFEDAVRYKNRTLYADRDDIPREEGEIFIADIIGLPVIDADNGEVYGRVSDVVNHGAQDLYEVKKTDGKTALIPAVPQFIVSVDTEKGVFIRPIEGLL